MSRDLYLRVYQQILDTLLFLFLYHPIACFNRCTMKKSTKRKQVATGEVEVREVSSAQVRRMGARYRRARYGQPNAARMEHSRQPAMVFSNRTNATESFKIHATDRSCMISMRIYKVRTETALKRWRTTSLRRRGKRDVAERSCARRRTGAKRCGLAAKTGKVEKEEEELEKKRRGELISSQERRREEKREQRRRRKRGAVGRGVGWAGEVKGIGRSTTQRAVFLAE